MKYLIALLISLPAYADLHITDWKENSVLKETDAVQMAKAALDKDLGGSEDGQSCGVNAIRSLDQEKGATASTFTLSGFVSAPYVGCSGSQLYHCRLAYAAKEGESPKVISTDCDPASRPSDD